MKRISTAYLLILFFLYHSNLNSQSIRTEFGKNRIQYHDDFSKWWEYETQNYIVYWYGKGRNIAQTAIQTAELIHTDIENLVEHRINDKIEIIVYTDISDLLQSNIGNEETFETRNDETKVIGSRVFVYFDGDHQQLLRKIKSGIAQVYFNSMYSRNGLQEIIDSDPDLEIPKWYLKGFTSYAASQWDPYIEDELRDLWYIRKGRYRDFNRISRDHPRVAGHSLWHYLEKEYGKTSITTLLYLMRLRNDFDENIEFIFGFNFNKLKKDWSKYYNTLYAQDTIYEAFDEQEQLQLGYKDYFPKSILSLNPSGSHLIYVVNEQGKYNVVLYNLKTGDREVLMKYGSKNAVQITDYNYPLIAWHPTNPEITIAFENHDKITLRKINLRTGQEVSQEIPENIQRIYSLDYISDEEYVMAGTEDGFSDLLTYHARYRRSENLTKDYHDDVDASYVKLGEQWGVLFSSNRPEAQLLNKSLDTILPLTNYDIYFLPLNSSFALRLTNTPDRNERQPHLINGQYLTYLDDYSGVKNRWVIDLNSRRKPYMNSNYNRNLITHEAISASGTHVYQVYNNGAYQCYITDPDWLANKEVISAQSAATAESIRQNQVRKTIAPGKLLQSRFEDPEVIEDLETNSEFRVVKSNYSYNLTELKDREVIKFVSARAVASRRQFKIEQFVTRVDNEVLFEGLESNFIDDEIQAQQAGFLIKGVAKDMFEDFQVVIGGRFPTGFNGSELFAYVDDRRKRLDKRYALYRRQTKDDFGFNSKLKEESLIGLYRLSYPFNTYRSVRGTALMRFDRAYLLNENPQTVEFGRRTEQRLSLKGEYIYDNTLDIDMNLRHGTRYKAYVEFINRFDINVNNGLGFDLSRAVTGVIGFDARHYIPFLRNSIIALRGAGASSFGSEKMLYYIGGADGWVTPRFNQDIPVPQDREYAFKTTAPNLRGFDHNIRNGQSYLIGAAELRIPLFKYFSKSELRSRFLRNIQLTGFFDIGSAWHGWLPSSTDNPINTATITGTDIIVQVDLDRSTFVYGYGIGARINLLGHYIRGDYAWGVESGLVGDPKLYISLGTEF